jgi:TPR repeat protein
LPEELSGAVQIFQKSCEGGTAKGCDNLLELCMPMYRVCSAEQSSAAAQVFQKACEAGNAKRCTSLGLLTKDDEKAFELFQKACDGGDGEGCRFVAQHLALNSSSAAEMAQIVHFYQLACDRDDGAGCLNLGNFYEHGTGVPKDSAKASILYKKGFDLSRKAGIAVDVAPPPK